MYRYNYGEPLMDEVDPGDNRRIGTAADSEQRGPEPGSVPAETHSAVVSQGSNISPIKPRQRPTGYALERIVDSYHRILMKFLRERLINQDEAEDVAQEVYYRIARRPDLDKIAYPKAFLLRTATNLLIDMNRCRLKRQADIRPDTDLLDREEDIAMGTPETNVLSEQMVHVLEQALGELSPKCQAVFVMHRIDGIPYRQITRELNLSRSMVEKYMRQALKHLKTRMEQSNG